MTPFNDTPTLNQNLLKNHVQGFPHLEYSSAAPYKADSFFMSVSSSVPPLQRGLLWLQYLNVMVPGPLQHWGLVYTTYPVVFPLSSHLMLRWHCTIIIFKSPSKITGIFSLSKENTSSMKVKMEICFYHQYPARKSTSQPTSKHIGKPLPNINPH